MPIHAAPTKPGSKKYRLVTDHSAGQFTLNNMISHEDIAGVTLNNVQDLGNALQHLRQENPDLDLILWKADVSEAYRCMPMHPPYGRSSRSSPLARSAMWIDAMSLGDVHPSAYGMPSCPSSSGSRCHEAPHALSLPLCG